jgi:hypothetical protein
MNELMNEPFIDFFNTGPHRVNYDMIEVRD